MKYAVFLVCQIAFFALIPVHAARAEEIRKISLESGMDFNTGKYGSSQSTDVRYIPFTGKYQDKTWTLKLTVPYLQITGPESLISVLNGVAPTGPTVTNSRITRSGLGDVVLAATRYTCNGGPSGLLASLTGKVKFGTASRAKGLGSGENDFALQSELYRISELLTVFGTFGFKAYGSPVGTAYRLNNGFYGSTGGIYKVDQHTDAGATLNVGQKIAAMGSHRVEAVFFAGHKIEKNWKARGYVLRGFTRSVPDWGMGATVAYMF